MFGRFLLIMYKDHTLSRFMNFLVKAIPHHFFVYEEEVHPILINFMIISNCPDFYKTFRDSRKHELSVFINSCANSLMGSFSYKYSILKITNMIKLRMGKLILNHLIRNNCPEFHNGLLFLDSPLKTILTQ